jgi:probable HAF family extracellular repeat protein
MDICRLAWAMFFACAAHAAPFYLVSAIGPAGFPSTAKAINDAGVVAGNYQLADGTYRAFVWQNGSATTLTQPADALQSFATGINNLGQISGYIDRVSGPAAVVWANPAAHQELGPGYALGINDSGLTAQPLFDGSVTTAINNNGATAGIALDAYGRMLSFVSNPAGTVSPLLTLGGENGYAMAISAAGIAAGHAQTPDGALRAVIWAGAAPAAIGGLDGINSYAYGINREGAVVGYADLAGGAGTAAYLFDGGAIHDLNTRLRNGAGWRLEEAYAINNAGQIAGRGTFQGASQAFLLTPADVAEVPEPKTLLLMGAALLTLALLRFAPRG